MDLTTNPFQEGGDDGRGPSTSPHASPPKGKFGPTIELMMEEAQAQAHMQAHQRVELGQP